MPTAPSRYHHLAEAEGADEFGLAVGCGGGLVLCGPEGLFDLDADPG